MRDTAPRGMRAPWPTSSRREEDRPEETSRDELVSEFDEQDLAFLYQEEVSSGDESRFHEFVSR